MPYKPPTDSTFRNDGKRQTAHQRGYDRRWVKIKNLYLREFPCCEDCDKEGKSTPADLVHHDRPLNEGGTHDFDNLVSLCRKHHAIRHKN